MNYADVFTANDFVNYYKSKNEIVNASVMESAGYFCVVIDPSGFWSDAHEYLTKRYGKDNYVWTGEKFWFDNYQDAKNFERFYLDWLEN